MMMGSNAMAAGVSFFRNVRDKVDQNAAPAIDEDELIVYEDDQGNFFFVDEDGVEID